MPTSHHMQNNNSKWLTDRKVRPKTTNLLEGNVGDNICSFVVGKDLHTYRKQKPLDIKKKINWIASPLNTYTP